MEGKLLGVCRVGKKIGRGGMGTVYRAVVEEAAPGLAPGATVAVKVVHPHLLAKPGFFKRFLREAEVGKRIVHPHVVRTLDVDAITIDGRAVHYLLLEYVEGRTVRELIDDLGFLPEDLCRRVARDVADALVEIHASGIVHRDLKPENILITPDDQVKLMDMGVALLKDEAMRLSHTGQFVGSARYAAPEQYAREVPDLDGRADLYALGLTLYEMATGAYPFEAPDLQQMVRRQLQEAAPPVRSAKPGLSRFFAAVVDRLLEKDLAARFPDAARLFKLLEDGEDSPCWNGRDLDLEETMVSEEIPALVPEPPPPGTPSPSPARPWLVPLLVGACLALFAVVLVLLLRT